MVYVAGRRVTTTHPVSDPRAREVPADSAEAGFVYGEGYEFTEQEADRLGLRGSGGAAVVAEPPPEPEPAPEPEPEPEAKMRDQSPNKARR